MAHLDSVGGRMRAIARKLNPSLRARRALQSLSAALLLCTLGQSAFAQRAPQAPTYDIVYVRAPRFGNEGFTRWPEVFNAVKMDPGADLMLLRPNGQEEVLFAGGNGSVVDPTLSFDAQWVYFSYFPDLRTEALNYQRADAPKLGADIYRIRLSTREVQRLTTQQWQPPSGAANWSSDHLSANPPNSYYLGYGIFNLGPCPLPGGKIMFSSNREGYMPNRNFAFPNLRLYRMDGDGSNVEAIGHLNIGSALHPTVLKDGRVMFASWEGEANRDPRVWALWAIRPDGTGWEPLMSAFNQDKALHFQTQLSDGRVGVVEYYNLNNASFGTLLAFDPRPLSGGALHGSPSPTHPSNPAVRRGIWYFQPGHPSHLQPRYKQYAFSPRSLSALSAFTHSDDEASSRDLAGNYAGKVTHPSGAPNNDVLLVYTPGPANHLARPEFLPRVDGGIYLLPAGNAVDSQQGLVLIKNSPLYNEMQPRAVVSYEAIYGVSEPVKLPDLANDGTQHAALPPATPFGIVGSASMYKRDTKPGYSNIQSYDGLEPFNTAQNDVNPNWFTQGADAGKYSNSDIHAIRIIAMEGVAHKSYGPISNVTGFRQHGELERYRILGEIPVRNLDPQGNPRIDPDGNPDTSFVAKIPADLSFTFQTLDRDGLVLNMAQTWHQLRPGEVRTDCGGCHAHSQAPTDFTQTAAGRGQTTLHDLSLQTPLLTQDAGGNPAVRVVNERMVSVEYMRDIKPILQRSCVSCHRAGNAQGELRLDDTSIVQGVENTYNRLANDQPATYGYKPVISSQTWRQENSSRYIRRFQARRSLLAWKVFGRRLDGWQNSSHPSESVLGNAATLPAGSDPNLADIDFTGTIMPPPGSAPALTIDEKMLIARWIDMGAPVNSADAGEAAFGWQHDEQKPTLTLRSPVTGMNPPVSLIQLGFFDADSGISVNTLSIKSSVAIAGRPANAELADLFTETAPFTRSLMLASAINGVQNATLTVRIKDVQGNEGLIVRRYSAAAIGLLFANGFEQ
jgi:hypothetical protein